ncbi:MAG: dienelactone hydrolase family protein [Actinobacteria bacterium]|nr:dienelactone hydrolase family protein [Actinomycetota bacterium]
MRNATIDIRGEAVPGILCLPPSGAGPAVIVIQEWWGLVPHIQQVVQRLADEGFVVLAVDHYRGAMIGLDIESVGADLAAAAEWLVQREEVTSDEVGVIGFCMGGGLALLAPTVSDAITCTVAFYPAMPWPQYAPDWSRYTGKAAIVHKALSDEASSGSAIGEYADAIITAGGSIEMFEYPDSVHAFFNDARPEVFQADNAKLAWDRTVAFLRACSG